MSSSRSIAAARNRRANENLNTQPSRVGPNTSISTQAAFSVQQPIFSQNMQQQNQKYLYQTQQQTQNKMNSNKNVIIQQNMNQVKNDELLYQQNLQNHKIANNNINSVNTKLSISDAIGLITLRLGKAEQFILTLENEILPNLNSNGFSLGDNLSGQKNNVDTSILNSIIHRLENVENNQKNLNANSSTKNNINNSQISNHNSDEIQKLKTDLNSILDQLNTLDQKFNSIKNIKDLDKNSLNDNSNSMLEFTKRLDKLDNTVLDLKTQSNSDKLKLELKGLKEILMSQIMKYDKFMENTNNKLSELDNIINLLNKKNNIEINEELLLGT